jgi:SHS2 domain-containing protein
VPYRLLPHTADIAVEIVAPDEAGLRAAGIDALRELLVGSSPVRVLAERAIAPRGRDVTERLVRFLQDVLYFYAVEGFVPGEAGPAGVLGEPFDPGRHTALREVKGVTYHGAALRQEDAGLSATLVFDV